MKTLLLGLVFFWTIHAGTIDGVSAAGVPLDTPMSLNVNNSSLKGVLELIAAKSQLQLVMDSKAADGNVTLALSGVSAKQVLEKLSVDQQIEYTITGSQLIITRRKIGAIGGGGSGGPGDPIRISLNYANAVDISGKVSSLISSEERLMVDERSNGLIYIGSKAGYDKVRQLIDLFDTPSKQLLIEAQIVETSNQFLRAVGISMGSTAEPSTNPSTFSAQSTTPGPSSANISIRTILGHIDGHALDLRLTAAESKGEAKVISRPKVTTLNNKPASIQSGITYHVKTLSAVTNGSGQTATGGVTPLNAGLSLNILPSIVGTNQVRLTVDINNSTPDLGTAVDGIPGISNNSANTTVIVNNKETAVIAGLIKQADSKGSSGVPILSDIPILGLLFKSNSTSSTFNELVIFLTPTIDESGTVVVKTALADPPPPTVITKP